MFTLHVQVRWAAFSQLAPRKYWAHVTGGMTAVDLFIWCSLACLAVFVAYFTIQPKFMSIDKSLGEILGLYERRGLHTYACGPTRTRTSAR